MKREFFFFLIFACCGREKKKTLFSQSVENKLWLCLVIEKVNEKRGKKNWALNVMEKKTNLSFIVCLDGGEKEGEWMGVE